MAYHSSSFPRSSRDTSVEPPSLLNRLLATLPGSLGVVIQQLLERHNSLNKNSSGQRIPWTWQQLQQRFNPRSLLSLPHLCILVWLIVLLWGERWVFESSTKACQWRNWERWVSLTKRQAEDSMILTAICSHWMRHHITWSSLQTLK
jgi:hypothetical protein